MHKYFYSQKILHRLTVFDPKELPYSGYFSGGNIFVVFVVHETFTHEKHCVHAPKIGGKPRDHEIFSMK